MLTLKQEIDQVKTELRLLENSVDIIKKQLQHLEDSRAYCDHTWDEGLRGWEHEGRSCTKCGVNDQYAPNLLKMVEARKTQRSLYE